MSVKLLIQEAVDKNILEFTDTLKQELRKRVGIALESKAAFSASRLADAEEKG